MIIGNLDPLNLLKLKVHREGCQEVKIVGEEIYVENSEVPPNCKWTNPEDLMSSIIVQCNEKGKAYLMYRWGKLLIAQQKTIPIIVVENIKYLGNNRNHTPILKIGGVTCSGYIAISKELFGYTHPEIKEIVKPYLVRDFDPKQLKFIEFAKYRGRPYPVFNYGKKVIKGLSQLSKYFPQLTKEELKELVPEDLDKPKPRHIELIDKYDLHAYGKGTGKITYESGEDKLFDNKKQLVDFLKSKGETVSRGTYQNLFTELLK